MQSLESELIAPEPGSVNYDNYLSIRELLKLQNPLSRPSEHDEMLFIIIHQSYELWFKQILHEVELALSKIRSDDLLGALKTLKRMATIQQTLNKQVDILETMTPTDFARFRNLLNPASGFQSFQFRLLEFKLGERNAQYLKFHQHQPEHYLRLESALHQPSFFDEVLRALSREAYPIPSEVLNRDVTQNYTSHPEVTATIAKIYATSKSHDPWYMIFEAMMDIDEYLLLWRFRHVAMVSRMIGSMRGTGGSSGTSYLSSTLTKRFFPDLWESRNLKT